MDPIQRYYQALEEAGREESKHFTRPSIRFRASEANDCARKIAYRLSGHKPAPRGARSQMYGIQGDADHDLARQMLHHFDTPIGGIVFDADGEQTEEYFERGKTFVVQTPDGFTVKVEISARADGKIYLEDIDTWALLEIKGMGHWPYDWLNKAFNKGGQKAALERIKEKHPAYYLQCNVTAKVHGFDYIYLLVKDRSGSQLGLHNDRTDERHGGAEWEVDEGVWEGVLQRFANIKRHVDEGTLPPPEFAAGSRECDWCPFQYLCHEAERRRQQGREPAVVYPGPQVEDHMEQEVEDAG